MSKLHWVIYFIRELLNTVVKIVLIISRSIFPKKYNCKSISNDTILITGGGHGIGKQLALCFAKRKPKHIILWGRKKHYLEETACLVTNMGVSCLPMICDVSSKKDIHDKADEIDEKVGAVSILVNNAGVVYGKELLDSSDSEILQTFKVNTLAHLFIIKQFLPSMITNQHGHIVSVNSILGMVGLKGAADYCSSKFASTGICSSLWQELDDCPNIHVTSVHPYQVQNHMFSGVSIRFPWLFPSLTEEFVAEETVKAVLTNRKQILLPKIWYFILFFQSWLPTDVLLHVLKFTGAATSMETFHKSDFIDDQEQIICPERDVHHSRTD